MKSHTPPYEIIPQLQSKVQVECGNTPHAVSELWHNYWFSKVYGLYTSCSMEFLIGLSLPWKYHYTTCTLRVQYPHTFLKKTRHNTTVIGLFIRGYVLFPYENNNNNNSTFNGWVVHSLLLLGNLDLVCSAVHANLYWSQLPYAYIQVPTVFPLIQYFKALAAVS